MVMHRIKPRTRVDNLVSEKRKPKKSYGRIIYLGLLAVIVLAIADLAFGHLVYLDADGQVMQRNYDVATEHRGTVTDLLVEEGSAVQAGQLIAVVRSRDVLEQVATLRARKLEMERDLNDMVARREFLLATRDAANERAKILQDTLNTTRAARAKGLVRSERMSEAVDEAFKGMQEAQKVIADASVIDETIRLMTVSLAELDSTLIQLEEAYNEGRIYAAEDGLVANLDVVEGAVVEPGDSLMKLYYDERFVLAQVPTGTAYDLEPGEEVAIKSGVETFDGRITRVYPVASRLAEEFQRSFEPTHRRQLVRIEFMDQAPNLPLFTTVQITSTALGRPLERIAQAVFAPKAYADREMGSSSSN
ncbi:MAG TPA: hypothetical protein DFI00_03355 [Rhodospirillaceae bacterium]|nr:hypothetical protein [Alphaproteobacteria bacterium]OUT41222.1 MAG: hypothetical protein CBB62_02355 [Micavibrio sp. TMED2]HCI46311.1 hypothetical protein [Rhodospirillaceae bacterium]MAS47264.1 hypothetical protein [Alphaproteobacteria bacterium]MAX95357.1 hypothetical protein [Alphaproteobacteria bacterium]